MLILRAVDPTAFERAKKYVGFDAAASAVLRETRPAVVRHLPAVVDDFYTAIEEDSVAAAVLQGGAAQILRLKHTLAQWLDGLLLGPHDEAYVEARSRIGRVHVRIGLSQELMFTAMNRIRSHLSAVFHEELGADVSRYLEATDALNKILDLELAIMLDSYRDHWTQRARAHERLSTIGQLTAGIGHELRNPLATIESSLFLSERRLAELGVSDPELLRHQQRIVLQVRYCTKTISDLLDLAREHPPELRRIRLLPAVERAIEETQAAPEIRWRVEVEPELVVLVDADDLHRVLVNLLQNAVQAQPNGGRVLVRARSDDNGSEILVEDEGPGIPPELRKQVFEALFTTRPRGSGLGLALCRRIMDAHLGEIDVLESAGGARLRVWFPQRGDGSDPGPHGKPGRAPGAAIDQDR